jgi:hypothetical protein
VSSGVAREGRRCSTSPTTLLTAQGICCIGNEDGQAGRHAAWRTWRTWRLLGTLDERLPQPWPQCPFACILERFEASCSSWESGRRPRSTRTVASLSVVGSGTQCVSAGPRSGQLGGLRRRRRLHVARADQVLLRQPDGSSRPRCTDR